MKNTSWSGLLVAALALALTLLAVVLMPPAAEPSQDEQVAIYAAAVRHRVAGSGPEWPAVFIEPRLLASIESDELPADGGPVPIGLVEALAGLAPRVELASADQVIDRDPNQPGWGMAVRAGGILVTLSPIQPQRDGMALLAVKWHVHAVNGGSCLYRLRREHGAWTVVEATLQWVA